VFCIALFPVSKTLVSLVAKRLSKQGNRICAYVQTSMPPVTVTGKMHCKEWRNLMIVKKIGGYFPDIL